VQIVRQNQYAERHHPESENRQKSQKTANHKQAANRHAGGARSWQRDACGPHNDVASRMIDAKTLGAWFSGGIIPVSHPQEMGINRLNASGCHFFEKTAWQIEQAFVLGHSHRGER
jgi:hypothetical protein